MRDPVRIERILAMLSEFWYAHPDLRLAQIVGNAYPQTGDPYYMEDDLVEAYLRRGIENL